MSRPIIVLLVLISFFQYVHGQGKGMLRGIVKEKASNEILVGAHIILKQDRTKGTVSDPDGRFSFTLDPGHYTFVVSFTSMKSDTFSIDLKAGQIIEKTIDMDPFSMLFDEVEIRAGKFDRNIEEMSLSMAIIKPKLIESKNTRNIETILDYTPGLNILDGEAQIRGGSGFTFGVGSKVALFLDDLPLLSGDAARPEWDFVPIENIEQVDVVKGAASVLSGASALSGAIYIRTSYPHLEPLTKINIYTGFYTAPRFKYMKWWSGIPMIAGANFLHSRQFGNVDLVIGADLNYDHGYIGPPVPGPHVTDTVTDFTESQMAHKRGRINFNLRKRSKKLKGLDYGLNGNFMIQKTNMVMAWLDDSAGFYRAYPGGVILHDKLLFYFDPFFNYYSSVGVKHSLRGRVIYKDNQMSNGQFTKSTVIYGDYQLRKDFIEIIDLQAIFGVSTQYVISHADLYEASGSPDNDLLNISVYAEFEKKLWSIINFSFGLRGEYYNLNGEIKASKPIFRVGANMKIMQETHLRMSYGQGYRFPTIAERYIRTSVGTFGVFDNPDLQPETSWNAEMGLRQGFKFSKYLGYLDVAAFWQEYDNTIQYLFGFWDPTYTFALAGFKFLNTGKSKITGIDISLNGMAELSTNMKLTTMFGYNYIMPVTMQPDYVYAHDYNPSGNTAFSYTSTSVDPSRNILKYRFLHNVKGDIALNFKNWEFGYSVKYFSEIVNLDKSIEEFEKATKASGGSLQPVEYMNYFYNHNNGVWVMDFRVSYVFMNFHKIAIISNNFTNQTYSLRPLKAESLRTVMLQYTFKM
ncbi:MAG: TonB-dependent receptor [Bacteroidota bacterium]|nr:TonB-dependent receptor [Bacteroidota bacterium]